MDVANAAAIERRDRVLRRFRKYSNWWCWVAN